MEWSNEKVLEFLELYQTEPCLWDPRLQAHKKRSALSGAWRRIIQALSFSATQEQLKTKKESLMGYYRIHLKKLNKSINSGSESDDIYKTNWFAFEIMDSFLRPIYGTNSTIKTESSATDTTEESSANFAHGNSQNRSNPTSPTPSTSAEDSSVTGRPKTYKRPHASYQKSKPSPEIINAEKQMNEAFSFKKKEEMDEYDYFAHMIASKIRKIKDMDDRELLMNSIQNLTFQFYMKSKQKNSPA